MNFLKILVAYIALAVLNIGFIIIFLDVINYINLSFKEGQFILFVVGLPAAYLYHKLKPMEFKELVKLLFRKFITPGI